MRVRRSVLLTGLLLLSFVVVPVAVADAPEAQIDTPGPGDVVSGLVTVSGTATSELGISAVQVRVDSGLGTNAVIVGDGPVWTWSLSLDSTLYPNGAHTLTARARDVGGISTETSVSVTFDNPIVHELNVVSFAHTNAGPGPVGSAGAAVFQFEVANEGTGQVDAFARMFFQSRGGWQLMEADRAFHIEPESTTVLEWTWTSVTKIGSFEVRIVLDPDDEILESDESNNEAIGQVDWLVAGASPVNLLYPVEPDRVHWRAKEIDVVGSGGDSAFVSPVMVVRQGDYLYWYNADATNAIHTATADDGSFATGWIEPGGPSAAVFFDTPGVYTYHCSIYPEMVASVVVLG